MARSGRPRKQQPHRPGAPAPIKAAGCGPERRVAVRQPKHPAAPSLRLTPTGWMPDLLGTWRRRRKKRSSLSPGAVDTIIDDRQYLAGRAIEGLMDVVTRAHLRSPDLTVPVVDTSFTHRLGGYSAEQLAARDRLDRLRGHLGCRDFRFAMDVLFGMGIHGAMLHEAGLVWRYHHDIEESASSAAGILGKARPHKIVPDIADASAQKPGSLDVEDRQGLEALGRAGSIYSKHDLPSDNGFVVDEATEIENTAKGAKRRAVSDQKADIGLEERLDELDNVKGLKDDKSKARREDLESEGDLVETYAVVARALHSDRHPGKNVDPAVEAMLEMNRRDPPPDMRGHGDIAGLNSVGSIGSFEDILYADRTSRQRAIDAFGVRGVELASLRFRALLTKTADLFEETEPGRATERAPAPAQITQITQSHDVAFDVENEIYEYATVR